MDSELGIIQTLSHGENGTRIHPTRVFVGGLARGTTELELENFFSDYGSVVDVRIVCDKRTGLNKGYGFVTYENKEVRDTLLKMGMVDFRGRKLRLREAVRRKGSGQFDEPEPVLSTTDAQGVQWILVPLDTVPVQQTSTTPQMWSQYSTCIMPKTPNYYSYNYMAPGAQPQPYYQHGTAYYCYV
ncbi:deleted in azoospermia protein 1-like [Actinia tenebrosa]|uniref:Deleted in azoospermia protein 1-like n=1 Tax=Actinia tenebrosa TaxID=6105 RepID=A0A6P8IYI1_ACTTE|nr:deleted in azoospermia protein 1-like [Actinia tenebrosa]